MIHRVTTAPLPLTAGAVQLAAVVGALVGLSPWFSVGVASLLVGVALGARYGWRLGTAAGVGVVMLLVLLVLTGTRATGLPLAGTLAVCGAVIGLGAATRLPRRFGELAPRAGRAAWAPWIAAASGGVLISLAYVASLGLTRNLRLDWVMRNDSANNLTFARIVLERGGISVGGAENPAPLPAALVAVTASTGREGVPASDLLVHDLSAMAATWIALIALTCLLAGLVAATLAARADAPRWVVTASAAAGSLIVLSWLFTGYPMQFGFLNTHVALVILLAAALAVLSGDGAPWLGLSVVMAAGLLMLASWSPLVVIPAGLVVALALSRWRALRATRGVTLAVVLLSAVSLIAYGLGVALPVLLAQREALGGMGGAFSTGPVVFVTGGLAIAAALAAYRSMRALPSAAVTAVVVSSWIGLGVLLFNSRYQDDPWTYYPTKFAWMAVLVHVIIGIGVATAALAGDRVRGRLRVAGRVGLAVLALLVIAVIVIVPRWGQKGDAQQPLAFVAVGNAPSGYPVLAGYVLDFASSAQPTILWDSGFDGEGQVNIWVMQDRAGDLTSELRLLAFEIYDDDDLANLCRAQELMPGLEVHTQDPGLQERLLEECPTSTASFVVETPRR